MSALKLHTLNYKRSLRKVKCKKIEQRLEALSETPLDLQEVTNVLECEAMWSDYSVPV